MISLGNSVGLTDKDINFISEVLADGTKLEWPGEYLKRKEKAVKIISSGRMRDSSIESLDEDPLFKRKNWNKVDSGFKLWGGIIPQETSKPVIDEFLESKNWNDMDSSFRLF